MSLAGTLDSPAAAVHSVGMGQLAASREPDESLRALGLGSCIGIAVWDPVARVGGMAHVVLPESAISSLGSPPGKYADLAVPALMQSVGRLGAAPSRLVCNIAGGAQMFGESNSAVLNIGLRNAVAVRAALAAAGVQVRAAQTGGSVGRTLELLVGSGVVRVRTVGAGIVEI